MEIEKREGRGKRWRVWSWAAGEEDVRYQVENYDELKITQSFKGVAVIIVIVLLALSFLMALLGGFGEDFTVADVLIGAIIYLPFIFFAYKGHRWAMVGLAILWTIDKVIIFFTLGGIAPIVGWVVVMPYFYKALKVEKARKKLKDPEQALEIRPECTGCGVAAEQGDDFCANCGKKIEVVRYPDFCTGCGKKLLEGTKFCNHCGKKGRRREVWSPGGGAGGVVYAGFWVRAGAFLFDLVLIDVLAVLLLMGSYFVGWGWFESFIFLSELVLLIIYHALFLAKFSSTPGKMLFSLRVVEGPELEKVSVRRAILRALAYILSGAGLGLGFFQIGWSKTKRGWHDLIAKTQVVKGRKKGYWPVLWLIIALGVSGWLNFSGEDYGYLGFPEETQSTLRALDEFLELQPANFQELFYRATSREYTIEVGEETDELKTTEEIAAENKEAIVFIRADEAFGSGFVVDSNGLVVTNYHVVGEAERVGIRLNDGNIYSVVEIVAFDEVKDYAVLKIEAENLHKVTLGDADRVKAGEEVVVIGNPEGLQNSVTKGVVSNTSREIEGVKFIQIDAAVSSGSSGGPVFDSTGQVIGIATMVYTEGQNLNFTLPINEIFGVEF